MQDTLHVLLLLPLPLRYIACSLPPSKTASNAAVKSACSSLTAWCRPLLLRCTQLL